MRLIIIEFPLAKFKISKLYEKFSHILNYKLFQYDRILKAQNSRVWFLALPDFLSNSESGTESTQLREVKWGATWKKK
jgi:hypothetical protein